jgi:NAD-dependent SIR2 family protein deacetylase
MSIGTMTCGTCDKELDHDSITTDSGDKIQVSKCPDGHGMIKSPMCCGQDMTRLD